MKQILQMIFFGFIGALLFQALRLESEAIRHMPSILTATGINIVDGTGRIRMQIGFSKDGPPGIWMMDERGMPRLIMGLYGDQTSYLGLQDKEGRMIQLMRSTGESESPLLIFKHQGQDRFITGLGPEAKPFLMYFDGGTRKHLFGTYAP